MTPSQPTVGIVGLGFGRAHIPAFQANGCRVVAVCQRDQTVARAVADRYGVPRVFASWAEMLETAQPEIVVIATPPHLHRAVARDAFAAGAHVLCEKPLALDRAEAQAMVEAAARAGRIGMTCFNWRFLAAMQQLHSMVEEGALGRVFHLAARWLGSRMADEGIPPTWRMDRARAGHGAMGDMGVHLVDLVRWSFGEFARVSAQAGVAYPSRTVADGSRPADTDDFCTVMGELASGAQVALSVSRVARGALDQTLDVYGSRGALSYRVDREAPRWWEGELRAAGERGAFQRVAPRVQPAPSLGDGDQMEITGKATIAPLVARLLEGIRTDETPSPSLEDGLRAQAVLDAIHESAARGGWVDVPRPLP
jgi:predicted dehydrogenase